MAKLIKGVNDLQTLYPELILEWDYDKNGDLLPSQITSGSGKKVWWKCNQGHEWQASIGNRTSLGRGCPYCCVNNKKVLSGTNDLQTINPKLAIQWNYDKNVIGPAEVLASSAKKVWWRCERGHEWQATINSRIRGYGCPYCSGRYAIQGENDLATLNPSLASEWHPIKNIGLRDKYGNDISDPNKVTKSSGQKVWWKCKEGHEWQATVALRYSGVGCPYCSGRYAIKGVNDLATKHPELLSEWDYEKNDKAGLSPYNVTSYSGKKVWWKCPFGHSYLTAISNRCGSNHTGCSICAKENHTSFPEQALLFYVKKYYSDVINSDRDAIRMELDIYIPSLKIAIEYDGENWHKDNKQDSELKKNLICKNNNILLIRIREEGLDLYDNCHCIVRTNINSNNSLSAVIRETLCYINNVSHMNIDIDDIDVDRDSALIYSSYIVSRKSKSLANIYPKIAEDWHPIKNGTVTAEMVSSNSSKKVWWLGKCGHEWQSVISSRAQGNGCPYCGNQLLLKGFNDFATTNPELLSEWNYEKNTISPTDVFAGSNKKIWWKCRQGHEWEALICSRIQKGVGCPYCSNKRISKGINDLATINPDLVSEWDYDKNNELGIFPEEVAPKSSKKVWWKCRVCGYSWRTAVLERAGHDKTGCPACARKKKGELKSKSVICIETKIIYKSLKEAEFETGINCTCISNCCKGSQRTAGGYHWSYYDSSKNNDYYDEILINVKRIPHALSKSVVCINTGTIYKSVTEAADKTGISSSNICGCCKGKSETAGGYRWKYVDD